MRSKLSNLAFLVSATVVSDPQEPLWWWSTIIVNFLWWSTIIVKLWWRSNSESHRPLLVPSTTKGFVEVVVYFLLAFTCFSSPFLKKQQHGILSESVLSLFTTVVSVLFLLCLIVPGSFLLLFSKHRWRGGPTCDARLYSTQVSVQKSNYNFVISDLDGMHKHQI